MRGIVRPQKLKFKFYIYLSSFIWNTWRGKLLFAKLLEEIRYFRWQESQREESQREEPLLSDYRVERIPRNSKNKQFNGIYEYRINFFLKKLNFKIFKFLKCSSCAGEAGSQDCWRSRLAVFAWCCVKCDTLCSTQSLAEGRYVYKQLLCGVLVLLWATFLKARHSEA